MMRQAPRGRATARGRLRLVELGGLGPELKLDEGASLVVLGREETEPALVGVLGIVLDEDLVDFVKAGMPTHAKRSVLGLERLEVGCQGAHAGGHASSTRAAAGKADAVGDMLVTAEATATAALAAIGGTATDAGEASLELGNLGGDSGGLLGDHEKTICRSDRCVNLGLQDYAIEARPERTGPKQKNARLGVLLSMQPCGPR